MFEEQTKKKFNFAWLLLIPLVLTGLFIFNSLRVNTKPPAQVTVEYTKKGPLADGSIGIAAGDFYSKKIDLNRKDLLTGTLRTTSRTRNLGLLVLDEKNFSEWKAGRAYEAVVESGYLPVIKVNTRLDPGTFFLVIDNRQGEENREAAISFNIGE